MTIIQYPEAEEVFVGSLMCNAHLLESARYMVSPDQLADPRLSWMYRAMLRLMSSGEADVAEMGMLSTQVITELRRQGKLEMAGGAAEVEWVASMGWVSVPTDKLARPVIEAWQSRELTDAVETLGGGRFSDNLERVKSRMDSMARAMPTGGTQTAADVLNQFHRFLEEDIPERSRIRSHTNLDGLIGDFEKGHVTTLAARPSCGKSTFVMQTAMRNAFCGQPVLVLSLEMRPVRLIGRLAGALAGIDSMALIKNRGRTLDNAAWDRLAEATGQINNLPIYAPEVRRGTAASGIRAQVESHVREHGVRLVVVDHLRLINAPGRSEVEMQTARIGALADMAAEFDLPFLVAAQINREGGKSERPALHHLEGSGAIEQDSETVIILHAAAPDSDEDRSDMEGIVAKARDGITGRRKMVWEPQFYRIDHERWKAMRAENWQESMEVQ